MPVELINEAVGETLASSRRDLDIKARAKALRASIEDLASKSGIDLKLRKKPKG
jgi:hypothetical protein